MKGSIKKVDKGKWKVIYDLPKKPRMKDGKMVLHPATGKPIMVRNQKWFTVHGSKKDAERKLLELNYREQHGHVMEPSSVTLGEWLDRWLDIAIKPPKRSLTTHKTYVIVINHSIKPHLGTIKLKDLRPSDIQGYYQASPNSETTLCQHHAILSGALNAAITEGLINENAAKQVIGKPKRLSSDAKNNTWTLEDAQAFLSYIKEQGPHISAFYCLALDAGMRKGELCGLKWSSVDLDNKKVHVHEQLIWNNPVAFGPVKNTVPRTIDISEETVKRLRSHKAYQTECKLKYGDMYSDFGLVFSRESGMPLSLTNLNRYFEAHRRNVDVRKITFHGLRHTCATLLLMSGHSPKVIQERLGHKKIEMTLNTYTHVLPSMQQAAADTLGDILHGS